MQYQAVLLIAFGGPDSPQEIRPFLSRVLKGIPIPPERVAEVACHYEAVGGKSPLNEITRRQARALETRLRAQGFPLEVRVGMRNSSPFFTETLAELGSRGITKVLGFILSSHKTDASWERYQRNISDARAELGSAAPEVDYCGGWHDHPLFIRSWEERIQNVFSELTVDARGVPLIFTAHSLPVPMAARSSYVEDVETTARLVAERLGHKRWAVAYQSRSGRPTDPWLEPDLDRVLNDLAREHVGDAVVAPIGFVCDHVEVVYDLDIEARKKAESLGLRLHRASCPNDHVTFIDMMADVIAASLAQLSSS